MFKLFPYKSMINDKMIIKFIMNNQSIKKEAKAYFMNPKLNETIRYKTQKLNCLAL